MLPLFFLQWFTCAGVTAALVSYWGQTSNVLCVIIYITAATCGAIVGVYSALDSDDKHRVCITVLNDLSRIL